MKIFDYPSLVMTTPITEEKLKELNELSEYMKEIREKNKITFPTKFTDKNGDTHETTITLRPLF